MSRNPFIPWLIAICFLMSAHWSMAESRTWAGRNGSRTEAEFVKQIGSNVLLKKPDGNTIRVPIQKLSDQDQQYLKDIQKPRQSSSSFNEVRDNAQSAEIRDALEGIIEREQMPGMVAAIVSSDGVLAIGSAGVRKNGSDEAITITDQLHMGSNTKAMTAVLMATLVADGTLTWDTTLIEVFPSMKNRFHADYHNVTVWQLLTHTSRFPNGAENWRAYEGTNLRKQRLSLLKDNLKKAPQTPAGVHHYSNLGYMAAGSMAEELTGETWETLMQERIFDPLGMTSAGFGPPGKQGRIEQPWGHNRTGGSWQPFQTDNAAALGPAGTVHCSIEDWGKFVALQFSESNALNLNRDLLDKLITPVGTYAGGWGISTRGWAKGTVLSHSGSNTMWLSPVWAAPNINRAYLVVTNSKDDKSSKICDQMIGTLLKIDQGN
ncbi:serine hydrolase [Pontiellaceae bacterium B12227]|nr:serine hydrolase [Pontiellaceae bacterium B12227]